MKDWLIAADTNPMVHMGLIALTAAAVIVVHHSHVTMQQFWDANLIATVWNLMILTVADLALHRTSKMLECRNPPDEGEHHRSSEQIVA